MKLKSLLSLAFMLFFVGKISFAQPAGWLYTQSFTASNATSTGISNYQLRIVVNTATLVAANQMLASGADIRFGPDCQGSTLYNHFIDSGMNSATTVIWVKLDTIPPNGNKVFYMYYGNSSATAASTLSTFDGPFSSTNQVSPASTNTVSNCQRGFRFSPNEPILVVQFGKKTPDATTRYVTLFDFTTQAIVRQMQVSGAAAVYSYQDLPSHVWLGQGTQYLLQLYNGSGDMYYYGTTSQIASQLTYYDMRYCNSCTQNTFPTTVLTNYHYGVPDFNFYTKNNFTPAPTYTSGGTAGGTQITQHPQHDTACETTAASFTITTIPAIASSYQWEMNTGSGWGNVPNTAPYSGVNGPVLNISAVTMAMNNYQFRVVMTGACGGNLTSNAATLTVDPAQTGTATVNITASSNNICQGTPVTFNATSQLGGTNPTYVWKVNGIPSGTNSTTFSSSSLNVGTNNVTCEMTSSIKCQLPIPAISNTQAVVVNPNAAPSVFINASQTTFCAGENITFTASVGGGGTAPTYQWFVNGQPVGSNASTFSTTTLNNNDAVQCALKSNAPCRTDDSVASNEIFVTVLPIVTPAVNVVANNQSICEGELVQFTANAAHPGGNPVFLWKLNGIDVGSNSQYYFNGQLKSGDIVTCNMVSDVSCRTLDTAIGNSVSVIVQANPTPVITKTGNLLATGNYAGYQWYIGGTIIPGATQQTYTATATGVYTVEVTANDCKGMSQPMLVDYLIPNSVNDPQVNNIHIYPNPTDGVIRIDAPSAVNVKVFDALGRLALQKEQVNVINLSSMPAGVYQIAVFDEKGNLLKQESITKE